MGHELLQEKLKKLREDYASRIPAKIEEIETVWQRLLLDKWDLELLKSLHRLIHKIAGSSGNYGFHELGTIARTFEMFTQHIIETKALVTDDQCLYMRALIDEMKATTHKDLSTINENQAMLPLNGYNQRSSIIDYYSEQAKELLSELPISSTDMWLPDPYIHLEPRQENNRLVFLVEDDPDLSQDLALQIGHFGYLVQVVENPTGLRQEIRHTKPAAIIMDVVFPEGNLAGVEVVADIQQSFADQVPVMFMSVRDDVSARLQAVRAGGLAYFTKPLNILALIDKLDELTKHKEPEPYRILIIDDDSAVTDYYQLVLETAGMIVATVNNPLNFMPPLIEFRPDLILLDLYMPECTGQELASVIRQQEAYVGIPIVFLSSETNIERQLEAIHQGGDDFLTKSISPDHLISAICSRAERARILRNTMVRDSLTGLFNHTTIKQHLHREIVYAKRRKAPLSFAMIDLDHFKTVNDTYGHTTGDRVLKSLSRVLQQRLRRTDIIGRYGGEEFAVLLIDTKGTDAVQVLDNIREDFSKVRQRTEHTQFSVSFSCGIADFPTYPDTAMISKMADEALYEAKHRGRNRIILA